MSVHLFEHVLPAWNNTKSCFTLTPSLHVLSAGARELKPPKYKYEAPIMGSGGGAPSGVHRPGAEAQHKPTNATPSESWEHKQQICTDICIDKL